MKEENVVILTREEIIDKLKSMVVGEGKELPMKRMTIITLNPEYDPIGFSQEIEDSEKPINVWDEISKETKKPDFDWVWNNTLSNIPKNSDEWLKNHSKVCLVKMHPMIMWLQCITHEDGTRDYYDESIVERIIKFGEPYGGITDIG